MAEDRQQMASREAGSENSQRTSPSSISPVEHVQARRGWLLYQPCLSAAKQLVEWQWWPYGSTHGLSVMVQLMAVLRVI